MTSRFRLIATLLIVSHSYVMHAATMPLFTAYPPLAKKVSWISLGNFPSPVERYAVLGQLLLKDQFFIKRDDLCGKKKMFDLLFGGNKVRKLEFLLADAQQKKRTTIKVKGGAGSNFVVAAATYGNELGLKTSALLSDQPNAAVVQRNLLLMLAYKAKLFTQAQPSGSGGKVYEIPFGGSNSIGAIGFVNAMFELKEQIHAGQLPEPDYIYVPVGSGGTMAGMLLGIQAAGLKSQVIGISVGRMAGVANLKKIVKKIFDATSSELHGHDKSFPLLTLSLDEITIIADPADVPYGQFTHDCADAVNLVKEVADIALDGVYSGKAFAGMIRHATLLPADTVILFWNTFCGLDFSAITSKQDYHQLPPTLQTYFTTPVQPLDSEVGLL